MAEVTAMRNNALPYPIYGAPYVIVYPLLDADGDPVTGATTPDAEISKNGDTFADCTNESTEIATSSGVYYLSLTGTELTTDVATIQAKSATAGMKTTVAVLYPRKLVSIRAGTAADDGSGTSSIVLDSGASAVDDFYNGMVCVAVIDSVTEVRMITDYTGSTKTASVTPDWNTAPDADDTFTIYRPDGVQMQQSNVTHVNSTAQTAGDIPAMITAVDDFVDTEVAAIKAKTDNLPSDPADASDIAAALTAIDDFIDTEVAAIKAKTDLIPGTIDGKTFAELVTLMAAVLLGKASGLATTTAVFRAVDDGKDRVTATVDADGNRSAVTLDAS